MSSLAPFIGFSSEQTKVSSSFEVFKLVQPTFKTHKCIPPTQMGHLYRGNKKAFQQYNTYQEELSPQFVFIN